MSTVHSPWNRLYSIWRSTTARVWHFVCCISCASGLGHPGRPCVGHRVWPVYEGNLNVEKFKSLISLVIRSAKVLDPSGVPSLTAIAEDHLDLKTMILISDGRLHGKFVRCLSPQGFQEVRSWVVSLSLGAGREDACALRCLSKDDANSCIYK